MLETGNSRVLIWYARNVVMPFRRETRLFTKLLIMMIFFCLNIKFDQTDESADFIISFWVIKICLDLINRRMCWKTIGTRLIIYLLVVFFSQIVTLPCFIIRFCYTFMQNYLDFIQHGLVDKHTFLLTNRTNSIYHNSREHNHIW